MVKDCIWSGMARLSLLLLCCVLLQEQRLAWAAPSAVFLPGREADVVLRRQRRYNSGVFEELMWGNLERECLEERCDLEEAREAFENDEKTMEFWVSYVDGDQCKSTPCQNRGTCEDQLGTYTCQCLPGYVGRSCEIVTARQCEVNNGDCTHFCESVATHGAECQCATGYRLGQDGVTCQAEGDFPCGRHVRMVITDGSARSLPAEGNSSIASNSTAPPPNTTASASPASRAQAMPYGPTLPPSATLPYGPTLPPGATLPYGPTLPPGATLPALPIQDNPHSRIVGGNEVVPGEIPWQVALVMRSTQQLFCGGSILSEWWVVTAAHCLVESTEGAFFVRVGEHDVHVSEGREQDLEVAESHAHPRYDAKLSLYNHDIALLRLRSPVHFSDFARPICLGPRRFTEALVRAGPPATVSGWGRLRFQGRTAGTLQRVKVPFVDRTECKDSSSDRVTPYMFCAGYHDDAKDSCQGDSGGPHANRRGDTWFLTGIVSWGEECAKEGKYGVYTRLANYYCWIQHVTGDTKETLDDDLEP